MVNLLQFYLENDQHYWESIDFAQWWFFPTDRTMNTKLKT